MDFKLRLIIPPNHAASASQLFYHQFFYEPIEKYAHIDKDTCDISNGNLMISNNSQFSDSSRTSTVSRELFTICANCSNKCGDENFKNLLEKFKNANMPNLMVLVQQTSDSEDILRKLISNESIGSYKFALVENGVNMDAYTTTPKVSNACQFVQPGESDTDALKSFSKTSVGT